MGKKQSEIAREIAIKAHEGQVDKGGKPYINHPEHVAANVETDGQKAVAWLHDVLEDTNVTARDLAAAGISEDVVDGVVAMTRHEGEDYFDYIDRVALNSLAREVKKADLVHNMDLSRLVNPSHEQFERRKKYEKAFAILVSKGGA